MLVVGTFSLNNIHAACSKQSSHSFSHQKKTWCRDSYYRFGVLQMTWSAAQQLGMVIWVAAVVAAMAIQVHVQQSVRLVCSVAQA